MASSSSTVSKATAERHQRILLQLLKQPGNDVCADCQTRNPRWASWNLGVFICVKCAGIHRKMGTHISKVKSLTMDSWTREQVQCMKQFGNIKSNEIFNPSDAKNPPPTDLVESERDGQLEKHIRMKYESRRFMDPHRQNESIGSCSASMSSGVSFTMSNSPTSSIYQQSSSKPLSLPLRSSSAAATRAAESSPAPWSAQRSMTVGGNRPVGAQAFTSDSAPITQFDAASRATSMASHQFTTAIPPLRPSTAPIPSDGLTNSQSAPPVPTMPSLYQNAAFNVVPITHPKTRDGLPSQLHHPSLDLHTYAKLPVQKINHVQAPPIRRDGVWGDLMQLTEPSNLSANGTLADSRGNTACPSWSSNLNPYHQPFDASASASAARMNELEIGMGKLMNQPSVNQAKPAGFLNQPLGTNNPFLNQIQKVNSASSTFQPFQPAPPSTVPNPMGGAVGSSQSLNPFMGAQYTCRMNQSMMAPPHLTPNQPDSSAAAFTRNPFMSPNNLNTNPSTIDQFGNHYPSPAHHQASQPSTLSFNHHPRFF